MNCSKNKFQGKTSDSSSLHAIEEKLLQHIQQVEKEYESRPELQCVASPRNSRVGFAAPSPAVSPKPGNMETIQSPEVEPKLDLSKIRSPRQARSQSNATLNENANELIELFRSNFPNFKQEWDSTSSGKKATFLINVTSLLERLLLHGVDSTDEPEDIDDKYRNLLSIMGTKAAQRVSVGGSQSGLLTHRKSLNASKISLMETSEKMQARDQSVEFFASAVVELLITATTTSIQVAVSETLSYAAVEGCTSTLFLTLLQLFQLCTTQSAAPGGEGGEQFSSSQAFPPAVTNLIAQVQSQIESFSDDNPASPLKEVEDVVGREASLLAGQLRVHLYEMSNNVRATCTTIISISTACCRSSSNEAEVVHLCAAVRILCENISELLTTVANICTLTLARKRKAERSQIVEESLNIWEEESTKRKGLKLWEVKQRKDKSIVQGTLNELIIALTSDTSLDNQYLKSFITTYRSFTRPWQLWRKLMDRFNVPPNTLESPRAHAVKMRVAIVLKYWVDHRFYDFDDELVGDIRRFIDNNLSDAMKELAKGLNNELEKKLMERNMRVRTVLNVPPTDLSVAEGVDSPLEFILHITDEEIARQLTLIDFSMYSCIQPNEFLGLAWSKSQIQAPNISRLINRLNAVAFWVSSVIVLQEGLAARAAMIAKFMNVAAHLRKMNNFHTLMGLVVGLSNSSVTRLKHSFARVEKAQVEAFKKISDLMSPHGSFKEYRRALGKSCSPCLPYMGVYLTDLTFIEDGNPDFLKDKYAKEKEGHQLINFRKREMVYKVIQGVLVHQQVSALLK